jgi:3-oxoacyl-[acyl-carrier protein] reductase
MTQSMQALLSGKRFIVTGASADSDIGLAICTELASAGAELILVGRRAEQLEQTRLQLTGSGHQIAAFDLTRLDEIDDWLTQLLPANQRVDGLIHSASFQGYTPLRTLKAAQINRYFDINFSAALLLIAALSKKYFTKSGAAIVLIGSAAGQRGLKGRVLYAASKAALSSMTKSCALELADKQIRINCVAPALVSGQKAQKQFTMLGEQQSAELVAAHPLGLSSPQDVAQATLFLLSPASKSITGTTLAVDGGFLAG